MRIQNKSGTNKSKANTHGGKIQQKVLYVKIYGAGAERAKIQKIQKQKTDDTAEVIKADRHFQGFALLTYKNQRKK